MNFKDERRLSVFEFLSKRSDIPPTVTEIYDHLKAKGFEIDRKTVFRDLQYFLNDRDINIEEIGKKPIRYRLLPNSQFSHSIKLSEESLETILMGLAMLKAYSPNTLENRAQKATEELLGVLNKESDFKYSDFLKHHLFCPDHTGKAVLREDKSLNKILKALKENKVVTCEYLNSKLESSLRKLSPLIFFMSGQIPFVMCFDFKDYSKKVFKLARMTNLKIINEQGLKLDKKELVELNTQIENSFGGYIEDSKKFIPISVYGNDDFYLRYSELKIHPSQELSLVKDGEYKGLYELKLNLPNSTHIEKMFNIGTNGVVSLEK